MSPTGKEEKQWQGKKKNPSKPTTVNWGPGGKHRPLPSTPIIRHGG